MEKFSDQGEYHDPSLRIEHVRLERTELGQQDFERQCPDVAGRDTDPRERLVNVTRHILQAVMAESPYRNDPEWGLWHRVRELEDQNMLPEGVTSQHIMGSYYATYDGNDRK
jgi:hypothetical protein